MRTLSERIEIFKSSDLYPVVSSEFCNGRDVCDIVHGIAAAGAKLVQIREKNISDCAMFELVQKCKLITDRYQMLLIVDDRLDIAMAAKADGVHLGQGDGSPAEAVSQPASLPMISTMVTARTVYTAQSRMNSCMVVEMYFAAEPKPGV